MAVALGMLHATVVLTEGGGLMVCGVRNYGQLGLGPPAGPGAPALATMALLGGVDTPVTGLEGGGPGADAHPFRSEPLVMVAAASGHAAAVTDRGRVWVWGLNHEMQLGPVPVLADEPGYKTTPSPWDSSVCGGSPVVMVACGMSFTLALTRAGHVWSCGRASHGQTGQAVPVAPRVLSQVPGVRDMAMVVAAGHYSLAVARDGRLWSWGLCIQCPCENDEHGGGQWRQTQHIPRVLGWAVFGGSPVLFAVANANHAAAVTAAGELWTWGQAACGCLGLGALAALPDVVRVPRRVGAPAGPPFAGAAVLMAACGDRHTVVLTDSGAVWTCGLGSAGALGHGGLQMHVVPTRIPQDRFGDSRIVCVAAGWEGSMAVTAAGVLYSWGSGAFGQGDPAAEAPVLQPTAVAATLAPGARAARTCAVSRAHMLAFSMGLHPRLGSDGGCALACASADTLFRIGEAAQGPSGAYAHMGEGLLRLLAVRLRAEG